MVVDLLNEVPDLLVGVGEVSVVAQIDLLFLARDQAPGIAIFLQAPTAAMLIWTSWLSSNFV